MIDRRCPYPRGKVLGGTSSINRLTYSRGNKRDYDHWAAMGNPGWAYKDVLSFFIKSENSQIEGDPGYHGIGGFWNVAYHVPTHPQTYAFLNATLEMGYPILDYNGRHQLGASRTQLNTLNGRRDSVAKAFLTPATNRRNLKILTGTYVIKILINKQSKETYGVQFTRNGRLCIARIRKEIILCAGTISSATILMHSGVGPQNHLEELGIPIIKNLSVGENLLDHPSFHGLYFNTNFTEPVRSITELVEQYLDAEGPLTIPNSQAMGYFQTKTPGEEGVPDIELEFVVSNSTSDISRRTSYYTNETYNALFSNIDGQRAFNVYVNLLHGKSHGSIRLQSSDPFIYPLINSNFLSDPDGYDIRQMYEGIQFAIKLATKSVAFRKFNSSLIVTDHPDCRKFKKLSKKYWYCMIRHYTINMYHPVGTCKMGPDSNDGAVVDPTLKVHGIKFLRVADSSIYPRTTSGHTSSPTVMIAEKLSQFVKDEYDVGNLLQTLKTGCKL